MKNTVSALCLALLLAACSDAPDYALGTLERDRISLPAPVSERIAEITVHEGQAVAAGDTLLVLESVRSGARKDAAEAEVARLQGALDEARAGPRAETIAESQARLRGAEGVARNARNQFERTQALVRRQLLPQADLDRARASLDAADADALAAREQLATLRNGTRVEQIAQAESALAAAKANAAGLAVDLERTRISAPRAGTVDSLPFEAGDQVAVGTPLATLLVGERPYARIYVPEPLRVRIAIGTRVQVHVQGLDTVYAGTVRAIRSEPGFTPYYALAGEDASRLSWLAEVELGTEAGALPVGVPVRAEFADTVTP